MKGATNKKKYVEKKKHMLKITKGFPLSKRHLRLQNIIECEIYRDSSLDISWIYGYDYHYCDWLFRPY